MRAFLGLDTSCYTTSAAACDEHGRVIASERTPLPVKQGMRGLRQSEAVFAHIKQLPDVLARVYGRLEAAGIREIAGVAASDRPRGEEGSYMPVFVAGLSQARALSAAHAAPLFRFSHQRGHIAAGRIGLEDMGERFLALHISGGTTELLLNDGRDIRLIGGSMDLHAGQLIDRVGVEMGLGFPSGPELERLAAGFSGKAGGLLPASLEQGDMRCHLSGAETKCLSLIKSGGHGRERIAYEVFDLLSRTCARMLAAGARETGVTRALVVGGVASSTLLRRLMGERLSKAGSRLSISFGRPEYSGDNAAGIAVLCMKSVMDKENMS